MSLLDVLRRADEILTKQRLEQIHTKMEILRDTLKLSFGVSADAHRCECAYIDSRRGDVCAVVDDVHFSMIFDRSYGVDIGYRAWLMWTVYCRDCGLVLRRGGISQATSSVAPVTFRVDEHLEELANIKLALDRLHARSHECACLHE